MTRRRRRQQSGLTIDQRLGRFMLICVVLFLVYMIYQFSQVLGKKDLAVYQVREGALAVNRTYRALVLRQEEVITSADTGYIAYFAREGEHLGVGDLLYAIDETGSVLEMMNRQDGESNLSETELKEMRSEIMDFQSSFSPDTFYQTYDFLYSIDGSLLKLANGNVMERLENINESYASELAGLRKTSTAGYVIYHADGMESVSGNISASMFDESEYEKTQFMNSALISPGDPVCKMVTSEDWKIVMQVEEARGEEMKESGYCQILFLKNRQTLWGKVEEVTEGEKGNCFVTLSFNTSMVNFCTDRYLDVEVVENNKTGLKIPLSSIVHKEFFLIPKDYLFREGDTEGSLVFTKKTFMEDGTVSAAEMEVQVYAEDEEQYYVDNSQLRIGDYLIKPNSQEEYPVSVTGELVGVYNVNKGYADFKQIAILYENEEYAIVKPNLAYGLSEYDYIALNADSIQEDDFVFE